MAAGAHVYGEGASPDSALTLGFGGRTARWQSQR